MAAAAQTRFDASEQAAFIYGQYKPTSVSVMTWTPEEISTRTVWLAICPLRFKTCADIWISVGYIIFHLQKLL